MHACGVNPERVPGRRVLTPATRRCCWTMRRALIRLDSRTGQHYDLSAHLLWIGERTRDPERGATWPSHVSIRNPLGREDRPHHHGQRTSAPLTEGTGPGPRAWPPDPDHPHGRRPDHGNVLPPLSWRRSPPTAPPVAWVCDPMHAQHVHNRQRSQDPRLRRCPGRGHRLLRRSTAPLGTHPGGIPPRIHRGRTSPNATGGGHHLTESDLHHRYETACDPAPQPEPIPRPGVPRRRALPPGNTAVHARAPPTVNGPYPTPGAPQPIPELPGAGTRLQPDRGRSGRRPQLAGMGLDRPCDSRQLAIRPAGVQPIAGAFEPVADRGGSLSRRAA